MGIKSKFQSNCPESFNRETDYCDWIDHFENAAAFNAWDESAKLQWLKVRLTALRQLPEATQRSYSDTLATLRRRFKLDSKHELYAAEFQTHKKCKTESWPDFVEDLQKLADRAYSYLQEEAKEKMSLACYLDQITDPRISFGVKQSRPRILNII